MDACCCCSAPFEKKSGGFKRVGLFTKFKGGQSAAETLEKVTSNKFTPCKDKFMCNECSLTVKSLDVKRKQLEEVEVKFRKMKQPGSYISTKIQASPSHRRTPKKLKVVCTPVKRSPKTPQNKITVHVNNTAVGKGVHLVSQSKYRSGFRKLYRASKVAKSSSMHVMCDIIRQEIATFSKFMTHENKGNLSSVLNFSWYNIISAAKRLCPTLLTFITAAVTKKQYQKTATKKKGKKIVSLLPIIGSVLCIFGYVKTKRCSLLQQMVSLMMWLGGCKRKVFTSFNNLGWCQGIDATKSTIDNFRTDYDSKVLAWRDRVSKEIESGEIFDLSLLEDDPLDETEQSFTLQDLEGLWESESDEDAQSDIQDEDSDHLSSVADMTPVETPRSSESDMDDVTTETPPCEVNKDMVYYDLTFDNINQKIGVRHHVRGKKNKQLNMVQTYATLERIGSEGLSNVMPSSDTIKNIPVAEVLPSENDEQSLHQELSTLVSRILTTYVPIFAGLDVQWSIPHQYSAQSALKSEIVPLGILNKDESTTAGMVEILENYQRYVPKKDDDSPFPLVLFCDGLSCERVKGAQRARVNGQDSWDRLEMYEPAIQEWHRRLMYLQDTYDELFSFESHREKGTLYNLKQVFDHKSVSKNIMDCFDKAEELLDFATIGYTVLLYMEMTNTSDINDIPENFPSLTSDKMNFRDDISAKIVSKIYCHPNTKEVINVSLDKTADTSPYCICKLDVGGTMVFCNNAGCEKGLWFHLECLGLEEDEVTDDNWFCSEECRHTKRKGKKTIADNFKDLKEEYVHRLLWRGLNTMARHDAVKENDGQRMILHWKFDMFEFYEKHHPKYFIFGLNLLANVAGATSQRIKHHLIWERTVNVTGGKRKNIPKDLHCEHINMKYKQNSRDASGQLTENTINRHSQMLGIGSQIQEAFNEKVVYNPYHTRKHGDVDRKEDIQRLIKTVQPQHYFKHEPGRAFKGFESFSTVSGVRFPKKFKERVLRHIKNFARLRELNENM